MCNLFAVVLVQGFSTQGSGASGSWTAEEARLFALALSAAAEKDWPAAFLELQRLLASVRVRRDLVAIAQAVREFAKMQERSGDPGAAERSRGYVAGRFG
jgi:hypothetical protein